MKTEMNEGVELNFGYFSFSLKANKLIDFVCKNVREEVEYIFIYKDKNMVSINDYCFGLDKMIFTFFKISVKSLCETKYISYVHNEYPNKDVYKGIHGMGRFLRNDRK